MTLIPAPMALILNEGECLKVEFKEKLAHLDREIVAMANAAGGSIFLGVKDDNTIIGIDVTNRLKSNIIDIARNCDPSITIGLNIHKDINVLEIQIAEGLDKPYRCKDGFFLRVGTTTQKLKRNEIAVLMDETKKIRFDEYENAKFQYPEDFSIERYREFLSLSNITTSTSETDGLVSLGVAEEKEGKLIFNNAGVLFFAKTPHAFFPESFITAIRYKIDDRYAILDKKDFYGSPIEQIEDTLLFVMKHMSVEASFPHRRKGKTLGTREDIYEYPLVALREAVVNAVTHRDYFYDGSHIYVHMYPSRIEIESPGGLYRGLTLNDLGKRSVRRNRLIADLLHRAKYIERVGSGFSRMKQSLEANNNPSMDIKATHFFNIIFYKRIEKLEASLLTKRQMHLFHFIEEKKIITKKEAATVLAVSEDTALRELNYLIKIKWIRREGQGKSICYIKGES